jgi:NADH-quinone oxidoreductase subunit A
MATPQAFLPILMMLAAAGALAVAMLTINHLLSRHIGTKRKLGPYESGMPLLDDTRKRISVKFFIVAMVFILFDVEAAFLYPWAVIFREGGTLVFTEMVVFVVVLFLGYLYLLKKGAFDWE